MTNSSPFAAVTESSVGNDGTATATEQSAASPSKDGDGAAEESIESIVNFIQEGNTSVPQKVIFLRLLYPPLCFRLSCCIASKQSVSISKSIQTASQNALRIGTAQELPISQEIQCSRSRVWI